MTTHTSTRLYAPGHGPRPRTYSGWQQEQVAFLLGLNGRRSAVLALAVLFGLQPITSGRLVYAVVTWPLAALLAGAGLLRFAGRTVDEWMVSVVSFTLLRARRRNRFLSGPFAPRRDPLGPPDTDLPGVLAPLRILNVAAHAASGVAVVHHPYDATYAAVAVLDYPGIGLTETQRCDQRVNAWAAVLSSLCSQDNPIARLQIVHRMVPEPGASLRAWHTEHLDPAAPLASVLANEALLSASAPACSLRLTWLVVTLDARRAAAAIRGAGGGDLGACAVLERHVGALTPALAGAELTVDHWLSPPELAQAIRTGFDPDAGQQLEQHHAATREVAPGETVPPGVNPALAGPVAAESRWSSYRHDGATSVTYAVHSWPVTPVYATSLAGLLGECSHRRAVSLFVEPLGPREAQRAVMVERTKRETVIRLRQRTGQAVSAGEHAQLERAAVQDAEHAAGHGLARFTGYVTITVTDPAELDDACAQAEAGAAHAGIELRRMYGAQDVGFALTLPVGVGLPRRRW